MEMGTRFPLLAKDARNGAPGTRFPIPGIPDGRSRLHSGPCTGEDARAYTAFELGSQH